MRQPAQLAEPPQPRTVEQACSKCGHLEPAPNGEHYGQLRRKAKVTLAEMVRIFASCGERVSVGYLSQMERRIRPFREKYAVIYVQHFDRRRKSGQDW